jgi:transcriptional regulator with XRE-family HTH domain
MADPEAGDVRDAIARRLDAMREAKQWTLSELAKRAGLKLGVLSSLHRGRLKGTHMKLGVAQQLCRALDAKVGRDLLGEDEEESGLPTLPEGVDLAQMSQAEKDTLIIHLLAEVLQRGLQIPPLLERRSDDG